MPITSLDPTAALIVVDLQKGIVSMPTAHPMEAVLKNARLLAETFRRVGLPVVLVNVNGMPAGRTERRRSLPPLPEDWTEFVPELDRQPQDHVVTKHTPGAFTNTGLDAHLRELGVTQVVILGVATSNGVEVTARQAYELGYNITLAIDAMTDAQVDAHDWSLARVFPRIGETGTTRDILNHLPGNTQA